MQTARLFTTFFCLFFTVLPLYAQYSVPHIPDLRIDGRIDDWKGRGLRVGVLIDGNGRLATLPDLDASLHLAWDRRGLLVAVEGSDDRYTEAGDSLSLWSGDSIELYLSPAKGSIDIYQIAIAPGMDTDHDEPRHHVHDRRITATARGTDLPLEVARSRDGNRYILEVLVPLQNLGIDAADKTRLAFQIAVNDVDEDGQRHQVIWYPAPGAYADSEKMHWIQLGKKAGAPVRGIAQGAFERFRRLRVDLVAPGDLAGKKIELRNGKKKLARDLLNADGPQARASLLLPMPTDDRQYAALRAYADGRYLTDVVLPSLEKTRREALDNAELRARPFVFSGEHFPDFEFVQPSMVEDLIGPYQIRATVYDADYNEVQRAKADGRYGALITIQGEHGLTTERFLTLYRAPEAVNWWSHRLDMRIELPSQFGLDPAVVAFQENAVADFFKWNLAADAEHNHNAAILLAGLAQADTLAAVDPWGVNSQWWYGLERNLGIVGLYPHLLHLPAAYDAQPDRAWPMLVFLHGSGERGDILDLVKQHGPPKLAASGRDLPFITVSPQCPAGESWLPQRVVDLVDSLSAVYRVDRRRIYLTGLSMGGYGTWSIAAEYPEKFAALVPICGGGDPSAATRFAHVPVWVFHGAKDTAVPLEQSQVMVDALKAAGNDVRFTVYPEAGHDSWTQTYENPALYEWLLSHKIDD